MRSIMKPRTRVAALLVAATAGFSGAAVAFPVAGPSAPAPESALTAEAYDTPEEAIRAAEAQSSGTNLLGQPMPAADAHHNHYRAIYHHSNSVVGSLTYADDGGTSWGLGRGGGTCCFQGGSVYVGSAHDVIETSRERPSWARRLANTGWYGVAALDSPGHMYYRAVPNGGN